MLSLEQLESCTDKSFSRSSGPGGQHANKSETKVQLHFDIARSPLSETQKSRLFKRYPEGVIIVQNQETRSQPQNTRLAFAHLQEKLTRELRVRKRRKKTKPPHRTKRGKVRKMLKDKWLKYKKRYIER